MNRQKDYDVLRLIEHNRICYVSSDNIRGCPLVKWIRLHPAMPKRQMFHWIHEMIRQMIQFHKCRGNPNYQYVNPYSIIVSREGNLCFLDIGADSNKDIVKMMQKKAIREYFLPKEEAYYQNSSQELDLYGIGKTIQYMFAFVEVTPALTGREERILLKMIRQCLDYQGHKGLHEVSDLQKYLTEIKIT